MIKKELLSVFVLLPMLGYAAADSGVEATIGGGPNVYGGKVITPENLYGIMKTVSPLPAEQADLLKKWMVKGVNGSEKSTYGDLLRKLAAFQIPSGFGIEVHTVDNNQLLQQCGLHNESGSGVNYVFCVPGLGYHIKIAGSAHRIQSALIKYGIWPGQAIPLDVAQKVFLGQTKTYQTASRAAYFLVFKKLLHEKKLNAIKVPDTHLVRLFDSSTSVHDDYVVIAQKDLPKDAKPLLDAKKLSKHVLCQLVQAIIGVGLWNIRNKLYIDREGKVHVIDLEQPNNAHPDEFFHKKAPSYLHNINCGLGHLFDMLEGDADRCSFVRLLVELHPVVRYRNNNERYKKELLQLVLAKKAPYIKKHADMLVRFMKDGTGTPGECYDRVLQALLDEKQACV